jgi:hypothetical protein
MLPDCSHVLVIQDDSQPVLNFAPAISSIAASNLNVPVCLFLSAIPRGTLSYALRAYRRGQVYAPVFLNSNIVPVIAILWPRAKAEEFMEWTRSGVRLRGHPTPRADDGIVAQWMQRTHQEFRVTVPSIVEHDVSVPSVKGGNRVWTNDHGGRAYFLAENALDYDW